MGSLNIGDERSWIIELAEGVEIQELDSAAASSKYLLLASEERRYQLSHTMAEILQRCDGKSTLGAICDEVSRLRSIPLDPQVVAARIQLQLSGTDILRGNGRSLGKASLSTRPALLRLFAFRLLHKLPLTSGNKLEFLTRPLGYLFAPACLVTGCLIFSAMLCHAMVNWAAHAATLQQDLGNGAHYGLALVLVVLSMVLHELGHASAATHYGARVGSLGVGIYLVWPVLYADVSDTWRLRSQQRVGVDLGGVFLQLILASAYYLGYLLTGYACLLHAVLWIAGLSVFALHPFLRSDGYWALSDAAGIPNLAKRSADALRYWAECIVHSPEERSLRPSSLDFGRKRLMFLIVYGVMTVIFIGVAVALIARVLPSMLVDYPALIRATFRAGRNLKIESVPRLIMHGAFLLGTMAFILPCAMAVCRWGARIPQWLVNAIRSTQRKPAPGDTPRGNGSYLRLFLLGGSVICVSVTCATLTHELTHALVGIVGGGTLSALSIALFGESTTYVVFAPGTPYGTLCTYYMSGVVGAFALGALLIVIANRRRHPETRLVLGLAAWIAMGGTGAYVMASALGGFGDITKVLAPVAVQGYWVATFAAAVLMVALPLCLRLVFEGLAHYVCVGTVIRRMIAFVWLIGLPLALYAMGGAMIASESNGLSALRDPGLLTMMLSSVLGIAFLRVPTAPLAPVPFRWTAALGGAALIGGAVWLYVSAGRPTVFFLGTPPEYRVQAANVHVAIARDGEVSARFMLQPFGERDRVLWERVREKEPRDWSAYEQFVAGGLHALVSGDDERIVARSIAPDVPFLPKGRGNGARVIAVAGCIESIGQAPDDSRIELEVRDFWKLRAEGYTDALTIAFGPGLSIVSLEVSPSTAVGRVEVSETGVVIENADQYGPDSVTLVVRVEGARAMPGQQLPWQAKANGAQF
jgi:putative peptide zinc metalloprotease protein